LFFIIPYSRIAADIMVERFDRRYPQITLLIGLLLILAILVAYVRIINCDFVGFDDRLYVTKNSRVQTGLSAEGLVWAFTTFHAANWHPLTWLSHMLDCQLYGLNPMGHHWTSLLLHIANTLLLFFILQEMTGAIWRSAFVAALFALHPLHVESVAWVAERKDVLSTFFGLLAIIAYCRYVKQQRLFYYLLVFLLLSLGLMAKPMLVTLPLLLLLLDFWPLGRLQFAANNHMQARGVTRFDIQTLFHLIYEKIPLFLLVIVSGSVTYLAQRSGGALDALASLPLSVRVANAFVSYLSYIVKAIWPAHLIVFYPHPGDALPLWQGAGAALLIVGLSCGAVRVFKQYPYLAVGWLWYLVTLVPVIGLLQAGEQAMADRYTYIPLTGVFIIVAWGASDLLAKYRFRKMVLAIFAVIILTALTARAYCQVGHWYSAVTLFENAVTATPDNGLAHNNLGTALYETGKLDEAILHFKKALEIRPEFIEALNNLGAAYYKRGDYDAAALYLKKVLAKHPENAVAHDHLGKVLFAKQKIDEAVSHFAEAVRINPAYADAHNNLAKVLAVLGKFNEAALHFSKAIKIEPKHPEAHYNFGNLLIKQQKFEKAFVHFIEAIKIDPENAKAYHQIGVILSREGKYKEAGMYLTKALQIDPGYWQARQNLKKLKGYE